MDEKNEVILADFKSKYLAVLKLLNEDSKNDQETEPYKSKYAAAEILQIMQKNLINAHNNTDFQEIKINLMLSVTYLYLGIVALETEELEQGENYLINAMEIINKDCIRPCTILPMISTLNQLGILCSKRDQINQAKEFLEKAEKIYKDFKISNDPDNPPKNMSSIFDINDLDEPPAGEILEKLHTLTLYYLAQIFGALDDFLKSAIYCYTTLKRQLELDDYDHIDWALNAATLSQFFMEKGGFYQARHLLSAATIILEKYENQLKNSKPTEDNEIEILDSKWENYKHRSADVSRCWAKYGILLLSMSRDRLISMENSKEEPVDNTGIQKDLQSDVTQERLYNLKFDTLATNIELIANNVTDKHLLDFNDAKEVFLNVQKWLDDAKLFYTLENQASDYVQIIQDMSQAYKYLIFFEENEDRQAKMHKRRVDLLEGVLKELSEKYYESTCQQIWIELGEIYSEILDIKLDRLKSSNERPSPQVLTKINNLTISAVKYFTKFIDSLKISKNGTFSDEMVHPALCTYFHLGRLYNKFITPDKSMQLENVKKSLEAYSFVVKYCEKDEKVKEMIRMEIGICEDFMKLLPIKINKLMYEIIELKEK